MHIDKILGFLTRTEGPPALYALKASAAAVIGMIVMILFAAPFIPAPQSSGSEPSPVALAIILLVVWPLISTMIIAALLRVTKRFAPTYWHAAGGAAIGFAVLLCVWLGIAVGIAYVWPFFIYATAFLAWQLKSEAHAWGMTILIHSVVNLIPVFLI